MHITVEIESELWTIVSCYAPQTGCEEEEKMRFWSDLDEVVQTIDRNEGLVIAGDFNGHVGGENTGFEEVHGGHGIGLPNPEGIAILDFATAYQLRIVNTMFTKLPNHLVTYNSGNNQSQIDFILVRSAHIREVMDCKTLPGEQVTSQHRIVVMKVKIRKSKKRKEKLVKKIRWWKLKDREIREKFIEKVLEAVVFIELEEERFQDQYKILMRIFREAGTEVCGTSSGRRKEGKETWWWNPKTEKVVLEKKAGLRRWKRSGNQGDQEEYQRLNRNAKKVISEEQRKVMDELYDRLDTKEGEKEIYRIASERDRKTKDTGKVFTVKDENGNVLKESEDIKQRWKTYFEELYNQENQRIQTEETNPVFGPVEEITAAEVKQAMKKMKNNKACGPDMIPVEVWKALGDIGEQLLRKIFNMVLRTGRMPEEWRRSLITPIYKGKSDILDCKNYRGIKLLSHTFKIWERIVDTRLRSIITPHESHLGFRPGRGTTDAIFMIRQVMEKYREGQKNLSIVFIDLEKAYDRVPREELWRSLRLRGVPEYLIECIKDMYQECNTSVVCAAGESESFQVKVGLHQGSALSPFLFVTLMDVLTEDVRLELPWAMLYADDIAMCMVETADLNVNLEAWREKLEDRGLRINRVKTEWMRCLFGAEDDEVGLEIDMENLKEVESFKYLGSILDKSGSIEREIGNRIKAGWASWRKCSGVMCDRRMSLRLKRKIHTTVIRPAMIYGAETWTTTKREEERLNVNEMRMLRWSCGVTRKDRVPNKYIRGSLKVTEVRKKIMERRLMWYGHVERREEDHYLKRVANMEIPGKRRIGRPKTRWKDSVKRDMKEIGLTAIVAQDRNTWRRSVKDHCSDPK